MAVVIPSKNEIMETKVKPREEILELIEKLEEELDDSYKIFFRAYLNGGHPEIIVSRRKYGIFIIEVKDWKLDDYKYESSVGRYGKVKERKKGIDYIIENPIRKVQGYKDSLYELYSYKLSMLKLKSRMYYGLVKTGVYFFNENEEKVSDFFKSENKGCNLVKRFGCDSDISQTIKEALKYGDYRLDNIFKEIEDEIKPRYSNSINSNELKLNKKQKELIRSKEGLNKKIKGESGAGKSTVIAYRAVDALRKNPNSRVLVLTFNITLRNYLRDRIGDVRGEFSFSSFNIIHFYGFMAQQNEKYGVLDGQREDYENLEIDIFKGVKIEEEEKYDSILIDEGQDFKYEWFRCLKETFLKKDGEFLIFADEKQNIYGRALEEKLVKTNIRGDWGELKNSYRTKGNLLRLAYEFQSEFYRDKYKLDLELLQERQLVLDIMEEEMDYIYSEDIDLKSIFYKIEETMRKERISINDITILGDRIPELRALEYYLSENYGIDCETVFEREEDYRYLRDKRDLEIEEIEKEIEENKEKFNQRERREIMEKKSRMLFEIDKKFRADLDGLRKIKKFGFNQKSGKLKISTTHSFKGWESDYVVLILEKNHKNTTPELIYTAITRCKKKLIIYNRGNEKYNQFFERAVLYKFVPC
ncbi:ATP-binding domain-containing protein [uncultured Clostridium sp.]|uniref:ATP-binding domain-containing protein n=1 Tax=uncultured Clostridium sp. TaxID=59620 RepID=UPI00260669A2|nr:ATP-binding domain-containing protein [uncultured Clostridium sp.]